jgi:predicted nucleic acid-binding protein
MIFDTDVLIWYFRGNEQAKKSLKNNEIAVSAITWMELIQGVRNKKELNTLNKFLVVKDISIYYVNEAINMHAIHLLEEYNLSDGVELADALIAATALHHGEELVTANVKHYRYFSNLKIKKFIP